MKPRLCLFTDSIEPSGVGEHMLCLAEELRAQYDVFVLGWSSTGMYARAAERGFPVYELSVDWYVNKDLLIQLEPHIMHVHAGASWEGHGGVWAARNASVPHVLRTEHLPYLITEKWQQDQYAGFLDWVDAIICVSEGVRRTYAEAGVPEDKLRVVLNGIPITPERHDSNTAACRVRTELGLDPGSRLVLTVGRLTEQKGYTYLLDAACIVAAELPGTHFLLAGEGPLERQLRARAGACGASSNVHFLGPRPGVAHLMSACDLFVLPSLFEGLPLVVLEAMSAGRAVVATHVCGTEEAVADAVTGRLVPARDPNALAEAITYALLNHEVRDAWGVAGRERVNVQFTASRMAGEVAAIYDALLAPSLAAVHPVESLVTPVQAHNY
ncbi:MAG TPA: glycosyltransferase family 4 protein [Chloroflexia bacterium]|nr:glycosyltransferase family 4 protein [Chloroflexia bacterium]